MRKSKKGITLVELVICCVIMILLAGACTAVVVSGQRLFISGSQTANTQLETNVLQTAIMNSLPKMGVAKRDTVANVKSTLAADGGVGIYFDETTSTFTISKADSDITVNGVKSFKYDFKKVGSTDTARTQFVYEVTMADNSTLSGGVVLINTMDKNAPSLSEMTDLNVAGNALYFGTPSE